MLLSDTPLIPDFVADTNKQLARLYHDQLDRFARSLGATADNAQEFELNDMSFEDMPDGYLRFAQLRWNGRLQGTVSVRVDHSDGLRYFVECVKFDHGDECPCGDCYSDYCAQQADAASY